MAFKDRECRTDITYVVARYSSYHKEWHEEYEYEYEELEAAKERLSWCRRCSPGSIYGLFERVKSEAINKIAE